MSAMAARRGGSFTGRTRTENAASANPPEASVARRRSTSAPDQFAGAQRSTAPPGATREGGEEEGEGGEGPGRRGHVRRVRDGDHEGADRRVGVREVEREVEEGGRTGSDMEVRNGGGGGGG